MDIEEAIAAANEASDDVKVRVIDAWDHFPEVGEHASEALAICAGCPVSAECLEAALAVPAWDDHGVRGGLTPADRRRLRRQREAR